MNAHLMRPRDRRKLMKLLAGRPWLVCASESSSGTIHLHPAMSVATTWPAEGSVRALCDCRFTHSTPELVDPRRFDARAEAKACGHCLKRWKGSLWDLDSYPDGELRKISKLSIEEIAERWRKLAAN